MTYNCLQKEMEGMATCIQLGNCLCIGHSCVDLGGLARRIYLRGTENRRSRH